MPRIRCHYMDCVFIDDGYCSAAQVELDPDAGCMTYNPTAETSTEEEDWEEEEELEEWEEVDEDEEEDDDMWVGEDEEDY
ncbi:MAG TPA: hypothetical protein VIO61_10845 [Anaerolineaceae bacterium]